MEKKRQRNVLLILISLRNRTFCYVCRFKVSKKAHTHTHTRAHLHTHTFTHTHTHSHTLTHTHTHSHTHTFTCTHTDTHVHRGIFFESWWSGLIIFSFWNRHKPSKKTCSQTLKSPLTFCCFNVFCIA